MSTEMVIDAKLYGHDGPYFPSHITDFHTAVFSTAVRPVKRSDFEKMNALNLPCLKITEGPVTSDDYPWCTALVVSFPGIEISFSILLPYPHDTHAAGGVRSDRHCAIYTQGMRPCDAVLNEFLDALTYYMRSTLSA